VGAIPWRVLSRLRTQPRVLVSAAWLLPASFAVVERLARSRLSGWPEPTTQELLFLGGDWLLYGVLTPFVFTVSRRWPIEASRLRTNLAAHLAWAVFFCAVWSAAGKLLELALALVFDRPSIDAAIAKAGATLPLVVLQNWLSWLLVTLPFGVAIYFFTVGIEHAIELFIQRREHELQVARLSEQLIGARLSALTAQLNPHFLFNSLNTIAVLMRDGENARATRVVEQLSDVLRSTLGFVRGNEVSLDDELDLIRQYVAVEQARFSDRLQPTFHVDAATLSAAVPSFLLQHLVENAIRHGIAARSGAGVLIVEAHRLGAMLELTVRDDGAGLGTDDRFPAGHGLDNARERLRALYGDQASLEILPGDIGTVARVRLPFRELVLDSHRGAATDA